MYHSHIVPSMYDLYWIIRTIGILSPQCTTYTESYVPTAYCPLNEQPILDHTYHHIVPGLYVAVDPAVL